MSGTGMPQVEVLKGVSDLRVTIVVSKWHSRITESLLSSALQYCREVGVDPLVIRVPGSFELPVAVQAAARDSDAVVALGVVIRGGTPHFEYVCRAVTDGLSRVSLDTGTPVGFGVLTCDTLQQAFDRAGLPTSSEDKGREACAAAIETAHLLRELP